jgi:metal-responsive CopG/Arc/MetJ family transcriptional regulator
VVIANKKMQGKRGPKPTTGKGTLVGVRLHAEILRAIDDYRRTQPDLPSRPEAIRRLIEECLRDKR